MKREIEIWFTTPQGRECRDAMNLREAKKVCAEESAKGREGIIVDENYFTTRNGERGDLIEDRTKSYSFLNGKLKLI